MRCTPAPMEAAFETVIALRRAIAAGETETEIEARLEALDRLVPKPGKVPKAFVDCMIRILDQCETMHAARG